MARSRRSEVVLADEGGGHHCVLRVVRRVALCGADRDTGVDFGHRRDGIKARLERLAGAFAVEIAGFAVMDNHFAPSGAQTAASPGDGQRGRVALGLRPRAPTTDCTSSN